MRAADIVYAGAFVYDAVAGIMAARCGGIWLLLTRSTDRRIDEERQREAERRYYQQRIDDMEDR